LQEHSLLPRGAFAREFRTSPFSWNQVFKLKKRWKASAAAIIKRAYDLRLIDAVDYRQSFKYMSARNWGKGGEPHDLGRNSVVRFQLLKDGQLTTFGPACALHKRMKIFLIKRGDCGVRPRLEGINDGF